MANSRLKPTGRLITTESESDAELRPNAAELRRLARADQRQPPAVMAKETRRVLINFRITETLADALMAAAAAQGTTQKVIVTKALAASGLKVPKEDMLDRTPKRRRRIETHT